LTAVGLIGHDQTYINWANDITASQGWQFALGSLVIILASLMCRWLALDAEDSEHCFHDHPGRYRHRHVDRTVHLALRIHLRLQLIRPAVHAPNRHLPWRHNGGK